MEPDGRWPQDQLFGVLTGRNAGCQKRSTAILDILEAKLEPKLEPPSPVILRHPFRPGGGHPVSDPVPVSLSGVLVLAAGLFAIDMRHSPLLSRFSEIITVAYEFSRIWEYGGRKPHAEAQKPLSDSA